MLVPAYNSLLVLSRRVTPRRPRFLRFVDHVKVIAHRGASHLAPENTLASVDLAWQLGADAVEVDVHLTRDGRIVAIHDTTTDRTAGTHLEVATTHSRHLRLLDVGRQKHPGFTGEAIPFLEEVLETVPPGRQLLIEVKCGPEILPRLDRMITGSRKRSQIEIIGFDLTTMKAAKAMMPDVPAHWLCEKRFWAPYSRLLAKETRAHGLDGLDVHWSGITRRFISAVREAGLKLYAWTVDEPADAVRLRAMGVDGITTNRPGWLRGRIHGPSLAQRRMDTVRNMRPAQPGEYGGRLASAG